MVARRVVPGFWEISLGFVNAFLLDSDEGLILIDTGPPGSGPKIVEALGVLGRQPPDIRWILVTHCHADHSGSLAEMKRITGASSAMHALDASLVREGKSIRPLRPAPGLINVLVVRFLLPSVPADIEPAVIDHEIEDGELFPGGLRAIHAPGHCAGQLAFLWERQGGVLLAADAAANAFGLALSPLYEDVEIGRQSLAKIGALEFDVACFGHGKPIITRAAHRFRRKWPARGHSVHA